VTVDETSQPTVLVTRSFLLLVLAHFLQASGYASMVLLPLYLSHLDASRAEIGAIMATAAISGLLFRPVVGWSLDAWGRKPTLIGGTILVIAGLAMVGLVDQIGVLVYLHRIVLGVGIGALFTGYFTFAADIIPVSRRTEGLALFGISGLLPLLINPITGQVGIEVESLRWFFPAVGIVVAMSLLALVMVPEPAVSRGKRHVPAEALKALRALSLRPVWFATFVFSSLVAIFMTFVTVTAESRGIENPANLWFTYTAGAVFVRGFGARLPDRVGATRLIVPALACYLAAMVSVAEASTQSGFVFGGLLAGIGHGYCFPVLTSLVVTRADDHFRGSALACFTAIWGISELVTSPSFGMIADRFGDRVMFELAALMGGFALIGWVFLERKLGNSREPAERALDSGEKVESVL
jgi:MFS family permease